MKSPKISFSTATLPLILLALILLALAACGGGGGSAVPTIETPRDLNAPVATAVPYTAEQAEALKRVLPPARAAEIDSSGGLITIVIRPSDFTALVLALAAEIAGNNGGAVGIVTPPPIVPGDEPPGVVAPQTCSDGSVILQANDCPEAVIELPDITDPVACADACPTFLASDTGTYKRVEDSTGGYELQITSGRLPRRSVGTRREGRFVYSSICANRACSYLQRFHRRFREEGYDVLADDDYLHWGVWNVDVDDSINGAAFVIGAPLASDYQLPKSGGATYQGKVEFHLGGEGSQTGRIRMIAAFDRNDTQMEGFMVQVQNNFQLNFGVSEYRNGQFSNGLVTCGSIGTCTGTPTNNRWSAAFFGTAADNGAPTKLGGVFEAEGFDNLGGVLNADITGAFGAELQE